MNDITIDKRIELIRQIRSQNVQNQNDLLNREQLLYGKPFFSEKADRTDFSEHPEERTDSLSGSAFRLRLLFAMTLLLSAIVLDTTGRQLGDFSIQKVTDMLAVDYEVRLEEQLQKFLEKFPEKFPMLSLTDSQAPS